jgi:hypothetical protein
MRKQRKKYLDRVKLGSIIKKFQYRVESVGITVTVMVVMYKDPTRFKIIVLNNNYNRIFLQLETSSNFLKKQRDIDMMSINAVSLPTGLTIRDNEYLFQTVFEEKLKIAWSQVTGQFPIPKIVDMYIDNSALKEEVIHKIVEVKHWKDHLHQYKRKKPKKKRTHSSDSDSSDISCDETELDAIRADIFKLKEVIRKIKKYAMGLPDYLKTFYGYYDKDNSDEIEFNEFPIMIKELNLSPPLSNRLGIMLFRIFDRRNLGYFSYEEFSDIVDKKMKPNYKRLVRNERIRWNRDGINLKWPPRKEKERTKVYIQEPA